VANSTVAVTVIDIAESNQAQTGYLIDSAIANVAYYVNGEFKGFTKIDGSFTYHEGDEITFKVGDVTLGSPVYVNNDHKVYLQDLVGVERTNTADRMVIKLAQIFQTLDLDNNPDNGIFASWSKVKDDFVGMINSDTNLGDVFESSVKLVEVSDALDHANDFNPALQNKDNIAPTVSITMSDTELKRGESATVTFTFSEKVTEFSLWDIWEENGTLANLTTADGGKTWKATFTPSEDISDTTNIISLSNEYNDLAGNKGVVSESANYIVATKNNLPVAIKDTFYTTLNSAITINPLSNDIDSDGDTFTIKSATATNGTVTINPDGTLGYTPNANYHGGDAIVYTISDGHGGESRGWAEVSITGNDAPDMKAPSKVGYIENTPTIIDVLKYAYDINGDSVSIENVWAEHGSVIRKTHFGNTVEYTPTEGYIGGDRLHITLKDSWGAVSEEVIELSEGLKEIIPSIMFGTQRVELSESSFLVNSIPNIVALKNSEFVATWWDRNSDNNNFDIFVQKFDSNSKLNGSITHLSDSIDQYDPQIQIAAINNGAFVVTWWGRNSGNNNIDIFVQKFDSSGNLNGTTIRLDGEGGWDHEPKIIATNDGGFVVVWEGNWYSSTESSISPTFRDIFVQKFDNNGNLSGSQIKLDGSGKNDMDPEITATNDGGFVVKWEGYEWNEYNQTFDDFNFYQKFNSSGGLKEAEIKTSNNFFVTSKGNLIDRYDFDFDKVNLEEGDMTYVGSLSINEMSNGGFVGLFYGNTVLDRGDSLLFDNPSTKHKLIGVLDSDLTLIKTIELGDRFDSMQHGYFEESIITMNDGGFGLLMREDIPCEEGYKSETSVQKFNSSGIEVGNKYLLSGSPLINEIDIVSTNDGGFIIEWEGIGDKFSLQKFDANGTEINETTPSGETTSTPAPTQSFAKMMFESDLLFEGKDMSYTDGTKVVDNREFTLNLKDYIDTKSVHFDGYKKEFGFDIDLEKDLNGVYNFLDGVNKTLQIDDNANTIISAKAWADISEVDFNLANSSIKFDIDTQLNPGDFDINYDAKIQLNVTKSGSSLTIGTQLLSTFVDSDFGNVFENLDFELDMTPNLDITGSVDVGYEYIIDSMFIADNVDNTNPNGYDFYDKEQFKGNLGGLNQTFNVFDISMGEMVDGISSVLLDGKKLSDYTDDSYYLIQDLPSGRKDTIGTPVELALNFPSQENLGDVRDIGESQKTGDYVDINGELYMWQAGEDLIQAKIDVDDTIGQIVKPVSVSDLHMNVANITSTDYKKMSDGGKIMVDTLAKLDVFAESFNKQFYKYYKDDDSIALDEIKGTINGIADGWEATKDVSGKNGVKLGDFHVPFMKEAQDVSIEFDTTLLGVDVNFGLSPLLDLDIDVKDVLFDIVLTSEDDTSYQKTISGKIGDVINLDIGSGLGDLDIDIDYKISAEATVNLLLQGNIGFDAKMFGISGTAGGFDIPKLPDGLLSFGEGGIIGSDSDYLFRMPQTGGDAEGARYTLAQLKSDKFELYNFELQLPVLHKHYDVALGEMQNYSGISTIPSGISYMNAGEFGWLYEPIEINGKTYAIWDINKDGGINDKVTKDVLDSIFNRDINGNLNTTGQNSDGGYGTTQTYRYGNMGDYKVALPTLGANASLGEQLADNQSYSGLASVWDTYNNVIESSNEGDAAYDYYNSNKWEGYSYWSADNGLMLDMGSGKVTDANSGGCSLGNKGYVIVEILGGAMTLPNIESSYVNKDSSNESSNSGGISTTPGVESGGQLPATSYETAPENSTTTTTTLSTSVVSGEFPVVLDINLDGVISYATTQRDANFDGIFETSAWVDTEDGVLLWDKDMSGTYNSGDVYVFGSNGLTDLEGLARDFDTNHDTIFDKNDEKFSEFGVLVNETFKGLDTFGIESINLTSDGVVSKPVEGVNEYGRTFAVLSGTYEQMIVADVSFQVL